MVTRSAFHGAARISRRVLSLATVASLLATFSWPNSTLAAYNGTCLNDNNLHGYVQFSTTQHLDYVVGNVSTLRDVLTCTVFSAGATDVLPANLQGNAFVQLGYGRIGPSGPLDWQYTPSDSSGGNLINPTFSHTKPIVGHAYTLQIQWSTVASKWQNYVGDLTTNSGTYWEDTTNNHSYGTLVWYGFEIHQYNDQFGGPGSSSRIYLASLGYQAVGSNTTSYLGTTTVYSNQGDLWLYYHDGAQLDASNHTLIWAYTDNH